MIMWVLLGVVLSMIGCVVCLMCVLCLLLLAFDRVFGLWCDVM